MSWNQLDVWDIEPVLFVRNTTLALAWKCPRCGCDQVAEVNPLSLTGDVPKEIHCANVAVCGEGMVSFELHLGVEMGRYKGTSDVPLGEEEPWRG